MYLSWQYFHIIRQSHYECQASQKLHVWMKWVQVPRMQQTRETPNLKMNLNTHHMSLESLFPDTCQWVQILHPTWLLKHPQRCLQMQRTWFQVSNWLQVWLNPGRANGWREIMWSLWVGCTLGRSLDSNLSHLQEIIRSLIKKKLQEIDMHKIIATATTK